MMTTQLRRRKSERGESTEKLIKKWMIRKAKKLKKYKIPLLTEAHNRSFRLDAAFAPTIQRLQQSFWQNITAEALSWHNCTWICWNKIRKKIGYSGNIKKNTFVCTYKGLYFLQYSLSWRKQVFRKVSKELWNCSDRVKN